MNNSKQNFFSFAKHVGIIMDGNRRWAKLNGLKNIEGHKKGATNVKEILKVAIACKVKYLTLFAFSSENWKRTNEEIQDLISLLRFFLKRQINELLKNDICLKILGEISVFPNDVIKDLNKLSIASKENKTLNLIIAINYGSRQEITSSVKKIAHDIALKRLTVNEINEKRISDNLYTKGVPDPDLIIRTGGDCRLSNFLLWQSAYSELIFIKKFWPEFSQDDFLSAIKEFNKRERRFGGL